MSNDTLANAAKMAELMEQVRLLQEQNAKLTAQQNAKVTVKAGTDKDTGKLTGTVSIYGLQRFPVSLYPEQWEKVFAVGNLIKAECNRPEVREAAGQSKADKKAATQSS